MRYRVWVRSYAGWALDPIRNAWVQRYHWTTWSREETREEADRVAAWLHSADSPTRVEQDGVWLGPFSAEGQPVPTTIDFDLAMG